MKSPAQLAAERGGLGHVMLARNLARSHTLVWSGNSAEIRDEAQQGRTVAYGTRQEMVAEAKRLGLWY